MVLIQGDTLGTALSISFFVMKRGQPSEVVKSSNMVHDKDQKGENVRVNVWTIDLKNMGTIWQRRGEVDFLQVQHGPQKKVFHGRRNSQANRKAELHVPDEECKSAKKCSES
ncbi:hypothetical protein H920_10805 [Fukomys damarensis]|uniref:Uncharacterized protein n=1 Tax=Fukomys damarensis TaxID=885580 RepID=A0A091DC17_FUKDA|nr:hypothetical protein H920_10805 [Fukomys damarensis]